MRFVYVEVAKVSLELVVISQARKDGTKTERSIYVFLIGKMFAVCSRLALTRV